MPIINVSNTMRLIELNKNNEINFDLEFNAKSKNGESFQLLISDQTSLDEEDNKLQYQLVKDSISGTMRSDKNVYKKYFIILKSQKPCEVDVTFNVNKLPDYIPQAEDIKPLDMPIVENKSISWRLILILVVICLGVFVFFYFNQKNDTSSLSNLSFNIPISKPTNIASSVDIFERLKNVPII